MKRKSLPPVLYLNQEKIEQILDFTPTKESVSLHQVPILPSFMCLLVREDDIDLSGESTSIGEIYIRMVPCLYKRFTIQKGINFEIRSFVQILKSLDKITLVTLVVSLVLDSEEWRH